MSSPQQRSEHDHLGYSHLARAARQHESRRGLEKMRSDLQGHLDDFEIGECIGRGSAGAVFFARQRSQDRNVAIKALLPPPVQIEGWAERFRRGAQALTRLHHPGIVTVHEFGQRGELAWLITALVEGADLRSLLDEGPLSQREALAIATPLCAALQYAHERGVVHKDIKPENILLDVGGRVKIADFGVAELDPKGTHQADPTQAAVGTPRYMAPEQLEKHEQADHRVDVFSAGVVFYEMLTGQVPAGVVEPPSRIVGSDARLDAIVLRALQQKPTDRFPTAAALKKQLQELGPLSSEAPAATGDLRRPIAPVVGGWTAAEVGALLVAPLAAAMFAPYIEPPPTPDAPRVDALTLLPWVYASAYWLLLPALSTIAWFAGRRRRLNVQMPSIRGLFCIFGALVAALAHDATQLPSASTQLTTDFNATSATLLRIVVTLSVATALAGSWSRRGSPRAMYGPKTIAVLTVGSLAAAAFAAYATLGELGAVATDKSMRSGVSPVVAAAPLALGAAAWIVAWLRGRRRGALLGIAAGAAVSLFAHIWAPPESGAWTDVALRALWGTVSLSIAGIAGSARPLTRSDA